MSFGEGAGVVLLTTVAAGLAAAGLAAFVIAWQQMSNFEGGSGYFAVFVILIGVAAGLSIGLVTALAMEGSFWVMLMRALEIVVGLVLFAGLLVVVVPLIQDKGPRINQEQVVLEVELHAPLVWKGARPVEIGHGICTIDGHEATLELNQVQGLDTIGKPALLCSGVLEKSSRRHQVRVALRQRVEQTFEIGLPDKLGDADGVWSDWIGPGLEHRFRLLRMSEFEKARQLRVASALEARRSAISTLPANGPLAQWLPFLENDMECSLDVGDDARNLVGEAEKAIRARPAELATLLVSADDDTARRALFAALYLRPVPPGLVEALRVNGRNMLKLIAEARAASKPGNPDLVAVDAVSNFYNHWRVLMRDSGEAGVAVRRAVFQELAQALSNPADAGLFRGLPEAVQSELGQIDASENKPP